MDDLVMRRRVLLTLFSLLVLFTAGAVAATLFIRYATRELSHLVELQHVDHLRKELLANVRTVQSGLESLHSPREAGRLLLRLEEAGEAALHLVEDPLGDGAMAHRPLHRHALEAAPHEQPRRQRQRQRQQRHHDADPTHP